MRRLWQNSLVVKFFLSYLAVVTLLFTSFYLYSGTVVRDFYVSSLGERLELEARLLAKDTTILFQTTTSLTSCAET